jgi:hypothetical protein
MDTAGEKARLSNLLLDNPRWMPILKTALAIEEKRDREYRERGYGQFLGWEWHEVNVYPVHPLFKMVNEQILDITLATRSGKTFRIRHPELVKEVIGETEKFELKHEYKAVQNLEIPDDLFSVIVGYDDVKELMLKSLKADMPLFRNFLLVGYPHSGKTTFLLELERIPGTFYIAGESGATKVGIREVITNLRPLILCVDEVDKLPTLDREILLSPADEYSRTSIVKHGIARVEKVNTKIFAAANPPKERFSPQFLDRFWVLEFPPYTEKEFLEVSQNILVKRRGIDGNLAEQISLQVWNLTRSIRDSLRIAEAIKAGMSLEKCSSLLRKYRK